MSTTEETTSMTTLPKEFNKTLQEWIRIDDEIKQVYDQLKTLRDKKHEMTERLYKLNSNQTIKCVPLSEGKIRFVTTNVHQGLTFQYLDKALHQIISNEPQIRKIMDHIRQAREVKTIEEIKRYP